MTPGERVLFLGTFLVTFQLFEVIMLPWFPSAR